MFGAPGGWQLVPPPRHDPCVSPPSCGRHQQAPGAAAQPGGRVSHHALREGEQGLGAGGGGGSAPMGAPWHGSRCQACGVQGGGHRVLLPGLLVPRCGAALPSPAARVSCSPSTPSSMTSRTPPPPSTGLPTSSSLTVSTAGGQGKELRAGGARGELRDGAGTWPRAGLCVPKVGSGLLAPWHCRQHPPITRCIV